jgi:hypothetical protein
MKKIMSLAMVVLFSVACAHKSGSCGSCASGGCGCGKDKAEKACACGAKDKANCKCAG